MKKFSFIVLLIAILAALVFAFSRLGVLSSGDKVMSQKEADDANRIVYNDVTENYTWICTQVTQGMDYLDQAGSVSAHHDQPQAYEFLDERFSSLRTEPTPDGTAARPTAYSPKEWTVATTQLQDRFAGIATDAQNQAQSEQPEEIFDFLQSRNGVISDELNSIFEKLPVKTTATQDKLRPGPCGRFMTDPDDAMVNQASVDLAAYTKKFSDEVGNTANIFSELSEQEASDTATLQSNVLSGINDARRDIKNIGHCTPATVKYSDSKTNSSKDACGQANTFTDDFQKTLDDYHERFSSDTQSFEETFSEFSDTISALYDRVEGIVYDLNFALPSPNKATEDEINRKGYRQ